MSAEEKGKKPSKVARFFKRIGTGTVKWLRDMKSELKKVVWPTGKQIANNTGIVLAVMAVAAVLLWGFDSLASGGVELLVSIFK